MRAAVFTLVLAAGLVGLVSAQQPTPAAQERKLELTFDGNGNVTLVARGVTVREILAEWSRKGGSIVSGADRLTGTPVAIEFTAQSEVVVLSSLLRSAAGLILVPRTSVTPGGSRLDVTLLATSAGVQSPTSNMSMPMSSPVTTRTDPNDEIPSAQAQQPAPGAAPPPAQQQPPPQNRPTGSPTITVPVVPITPVGPGTSTTTTTGGRGGGGGR